MATCSNDVPELLVDYESPIWEDFENIEIDSMFDLPENDEQVDDSKVESSTKTNPAAFCKLSMEMQRKACTKIMEDKCFPESSHLLVATLQDNLLLHEKLRFLDSCLVPKGRSLQVAKDKAWSNFNNLYTLNAIHIYTFIQPQGLAFIFCLKLFEILVENYYCEPQTKKEGQKSVEIKYQDKDILDYIGGCILFKIKNQVGRLNETDVKKHIKLNIINVLVENDSEKSESCSLTNVLNRGSLIHIRSDLSTFFVKIESIFRIIFPNPVESFFSLESFIKRCLDTNDIVKCFFDSCNHSLAEHSEKMFILKLILKLFFKIRVHRKCKLFLEKYRKQKQISSKEKGLRKKLKQVKK
ncbi:uncharacterized protein LOC129928112 isoform X2 [Biomphalaria glabrata]|nr:uncharacterized protein LOC129928112 isoform X2 [Biomphalaria glabrata]XP_055896737.1 uncharacterized protein LOC129928112 isoform X2 [Biomphalaria glabrata]XP_055896745.1 uncharacterized protein LOC129928112 isoform X2 [Biomphalaria glabrata]